MKLSNPIKLKKGSEIIDISVYHVSDVDEETFNYVDEEDNPLYEDTEFCAVCRDTVSMRIKDDSFDDMIFKCECDRIDPIELHEYLLVDRSNLGVIDFCLDFSRKFGNPFDTSREDSLIYANMEKHSGWSCYTLEEPIRSAVVSSIRCHHVDGLIDIIEIDFSDEDAINIYLNLDKYKKVRVSPVSSFTIIERILCMLEPRCSTGKEELLKKITNYFGFLADVVDVHGKYIVQSYLSRVAENLSIFYVKQENKLHTKFIPMYLNAPVADISSIDASLDDMKIFQDANMVFDL
jgi:hypothetical protein